MQRRKKNSKEFKQEADNLALIPSSSIRQIAKVLELNATMLGRWCRESVRNRSQAQGHLRDEGGAGLKRELAKVKKERDFLNEAAVFCARESK
jgi:transposase